MNKVLFVSIHLACLLVFWTGASVAAVSLCLAMYLVRMFAITAGYHRLLSHRSYSTSRWFRFLISFIATSSAQKGPLWWAASHRHHHRHSDTEEDLHSPGKKGIWWAHMGWVLSEQHDDADLNLVKDLNSQWELRLLDKYHFIPPLMVLPFVAGIALAFPQLGMSPLQAMAWGGFVSTVCLYHGTFAINSLAHILGKKRFKTGDESRNSFLLSLVTLGEGWHNNHHRYPGSERQGFYWWEIDLTHYVLYLLSLFGIVWDLRSPPRRIYEEAAASSN